jgi:hypothetical protein
LLRKQNAVLFASAQHVPQGRYPMRIRIRRVTAHGARQNPRLSTTTTMPDDKSCGISLSRTSTQPLLLASEPRAGHSEIGERDKTAGWPSEFAYWSGLDIHGPVYLPYSFTPWLWLVTPADTEVDPLGGSGSRCWGMLCCYRNHRRPRLTSPTQRSFLYGRLLSSGLGIRIRICLQPT